MGQIKTIPNRASVQEFLGSIENVRRREDGLALLKIFGRMTGESPIMWGASIVGYGRYRAKTKSNQENEWPLVAFSPRKQALSLYLINGDHGRYTNLLARLGKYKLSVACLYVNKLTDIDMGVLSELIERCYRDNKRELVAF